MNGKGGGYCVAARYGTGHGIMYGMSKVDSIMLKFRPIAPKPVATGSGSSSSTTDKSDKYVKCGRSKRRYVRINKSKKMKDNFKRSVVEKKKTVKVSPPSSQPVVTLPLLPETPDRKETKPVTVCFSELVSPTHNKKVAPPQPLWLSFNNHIVMKPTPGRTYVVSNVTVECVTTDAWVYLEGLGCTDEERVVNMEKDTCPGFISDGQDRVVWTNKAYRQMAGVGSDVDGDHDVEVVLVRKDKWPVASPAFTCKVRVTFAAACGGGRQTLLPSSPTLTLPCDAWRMSHGAYAWRLDVKAALSLGR